MSSTAIVAYLALFATVGFLFLFAALLFGWFLRAKAPTPEKQEIYECGEPTIGSGFVQFDLRFYVVALLFIIFDVEVAFFFPWATVFGKATQLTDPSFVSATADGGLTPAAEGLLRELGVREPMVPKQEGPLFTPTIAEARHVEAVRGERSPERAGAEWSLARAGSLLARAALVDMTAFFAVLLTGFAYVWYRGDLDWVRAVSAERAGSAGRVATR